MKSVALLLTATITPQAGVPSLAVRSPELRRAEYMKSLEFATRLDPKVVPAIVFAENSGADLSDFARVAERDGRVELLSVSSSGVPAEWGRGYLETSLVISAAKRSETIAAGDGPVWKLTGRYIAHNLTRVISSAPPGKDLYVNLRRSPVRWGDMWLYGTTQRGLQLLEECLPRLRVVGEEPAEPSFFDVMMEFLDRGEKVEPRLAVEPLISGLRGYDGRPYGGMKQWAKWLTRSATKRLAPSIWV